jgi:hypothetical protein
MTKDTQGEGQTQVKTQDRSSPLKTTPSREKQDKKPKKKNEKTRENERQSKGSIKKT